MDELLAGLGDDFTPNQKRALRTLIDRLVGALFTDALESLPERLRAIARELSANGEYDRGVRDGVTLAATVIQGILQNANQLRGSSLANEAPAPSV